MTAKWLALLMIAFLPPALYAIWIRNTERRHREPWIPLVVCFVWGATLAVVVTVILEVLLRIPLSRSLIGGNFRELVSVAVIAPVVEEFAKPIVLGFKIVRRKSDEIEDGFVYGAAAGLGFSATENLSYEWRYVSAGLLLFLILVVVRSIACCLVHASTTAITGYGYARSIVERKPFVAALPFFLLAIGIHAFYNSMVFLVSFVILGGVISIAAAFVFAFLCVRFVRKKIREFDRRR